MAGDSARAIDAACAAAGTDPRHRLRERQRHGTSYADCAEAAALRQALGPTWPRHRQSPPSRPRHALEASALLEFVLTVLVLRAGLLPVNAGYLGPDLLRADLVLGSARSARGAGTHEPEPAFGGASTALLVAAP